MILTSLLLSILICINSLSLTSSFAPYSVTRISSSRVLHRYDNSNIPIVRYVSLLHAKAAKKKKKKGGGGSSGGMKGFGAPVVASSSSKVDIDRSKEARTFYDFMERKNAGDTLKRCTLGYFQIPDGMGGEFSLRGVVATRDMKKGDVIIRIPYELAVNLGPEGEDPTKPAMTFLYDYCKTMQEENSDGSFRRPYYSMLPPFQGADCLGSTDFFSEEALDALQYPLIKEETLRRRERTKQRFAREFGIHDDEDKHDGWGIKVEDDDKDSKDKPEIPSWNDNTPITEEHLQWAVWVVTSRVLTVQGDEGRSYKLLIPFLDMCNHDRTSPHVLTGRAIPGGELKVVAGANIKVGEQINICYGGGVAGNDRFVQDYGFLDSHVEAYRLVAEQVLGKRRLLEGSDAGKSMAMADQERILETLRSTTMAQDEEVLLQAKGGGAMRSAIEYRLGLKQALAKFVVMP